MSYLKRLTNAALGQLQAFRMYGGIGMSASSLYRESTDSLIYCMLTVTMLWSHSRELRRVTMTPSHYLRILVYYALSLLG